MWWLVPPHREPVPALRFPFFRKIVSTAGAEPGPGSGWVLALTLDTDGWRVTADETESPRFGSEPMPCLPQRFDAVRAARRLLHAADDVINPRVYA